MRGRVLTVVAAAGLVVATAGLTILATAGPALAKGPDQASIGGPGLAHPIVVAGEGEPGSGGRLSSLGDGSGLFLAMFGAPDGQELTAQQPAGALGPRYQLTYRVPNGEPNPDTVTQDLYPLAAGGPVTYTREGQRSMGGPTRGGWYRAPDGFAELLVTLGVPGVVVPGGDPTAQTGARPTARPTAPPTAPPTPRPAGAADGAGRGGPARGSGWPLVAGGVLAGCVVAAGLAGAVALHRRRAVARS